jgi:hypothetical protein
MQVRACRVNCAFPVGQEHIKACLDMSNVPHVLCIQVRLLAAPSFSIVPVSQAFMAPVLQIALSVWLASTTAPMGMGGAMAWRVEAVHVRIVHHDPCHQQAAWSHQNVHVLPVLLVQTGKPAKSAKLESTSLNSGLMTAQNVSEIHSHRLEATDQKRVRAIEVIKAVVTRSAQM